MTAVGQLAHKSDRYLHSYDERFEPHFGPLRSVIAPAVESFLGCGRLMGGFARIRCPFLQGRAPAGLFQRERKLLTILSRSAYDALRKTFQAALGRKGVRPGCVTSIQTFGSFGANFHPHIHMIATAGALTEDGEFLPLPDVDTKVVEEIFRRVVLGRLHRAKRLSEEFLVSLLSWQRSGFSAHADRPVEAEDRSSLERLVRYITRAPIRIDTITIDDEGRVRIATPPDPRSDATELVLDPLEWIHAIATQIPEPRSHLTRYYGAYASRTRAAGRFGAKRPHHARVEEEAPLSPAPKRSRASWARLLRRILEVDPLLCATCRVEMTIVAVIVDPPVIDHILRHLVSGGGHDPFEARAPPPL